ncbi:MAG: aminoacyl--tRNA ligase-related protein [Candidatus Woesearchaeota archaeon]|jgi:threonyl-tRNA synthetase
MENNQKFKNREEIVKEIQSRHLILMPDGREMLLDLKNPEEVKRILDEVGDEELKAYMLSEELKGQPKEEPPSIKMMQQHELIGYEPSSDSGNFSMWPKGNLIFSLLRDWSHEIAVNRLQAMQIESPVLYDWSDPEIQEQAGSFHERHYIVKAPDDDKKEFILRFAADFGLFKIMKKANFSHKMLPVRMYEFSKSFRYEKSGELSGLKRLRAFHIPDLHCFCKDIPQGWVEYQHLYKEYVNLAKGAGVKYAVGFRIVEEFYKEHKERLVELLQYSKRPAFIEVLSKMKHYWAVKNEFQGIDSVGGNMQLVTVQLDVKDAKVYGINYVDSDGSKKGCIICHSSIGSIERWIYAILEEALKKEKPQLPLWLSPSQIRLIPVNQAQIEYCKSLKFDGVRIDIDDSNDSLGKKIANANKEWIPYVAVIGNKEMESGKLMVNIREDGSKKEFSIVELENEIKSKSQGMPFRPLPVPKLVSQRPIFYG